MSTKNESQPSQAASQGPLTPKAPQKPKPAKEAPKPRTALEVWFSQGERCYHASFHQAIPPSNNSEPVNEFKLESKAQGKYLVEDMTYTPYGLIWRQKGELNITPLANVAFARLIVG